MHVHKKFEINSTKIKVSCQSGRKVVPHDSKSDMPLAYLAFTELSIAVMVFENVLPVLCKIVVLVLHCFSFLKTNSLPLDSRKPPKLVALASSSSGLIRVLLWAMILARMAASLSLSNLSDKSLKLPLLMESWAFWGASNFSASLFSICCCEALKHRI